MHIRLAQLNISVPVLYSSIRLPLCLIINVILPHTLPSTSCDSQLLNRMRSELSRTLLSKCWIVKCSLQCSWIGILSVGRIFVLIICWRIATSCGCVTEEPLQQSSVTKLDPLFLPNCKTEVAAHFMIHARNKDLIQTVALIMNVLRPSNLCCQIAWKFHTWFQRRLLHMCHAITASNQMVLKVHCCPIILLITFHQIKQPLKFALTLVRALSAFASAPVPCVSALFTTLMRSMFTFFDWVGLPVCATSFHISGLCWRSKRAPSSSTPN